MTRPFVSVLIDTYNHEKFIEQAIVSVLEQDFAAADREILVVDDGSTDRTPEIVKKFEPQVRLLRKNNGGQASAFNAGIPKCRGGIIAFLDGDDMWCGSKLDAVVLAFTENPDVGAVGHGIYEVDEAGQRRFSIVPDQCRRSSLRTLEGARAFIQLRCFLGTSRFAARKAVLEKILPVPEGLLIEADEYLATMATASAGAQVLEAPLTCYRLHSNNLFQYSDSDEVKQTRKLAALKCLDTVLPAELAKLRIPPHVISVLRQPNWIDAERLRLSLGEGWGWETVRVERAAFHAAGPDAPLGYSVFHTCVLVAALVLPPRQFYRLRRWYFDHRMGDVRQRVGERLQAPSFVLRKACS